MHYRALSWDLSCLISLAMTSGKNEYTLTMFADDAKLREAVDITEGKTAVHRDVESPEEWANRNFMKFNKDKCKVLDPGRKNPLQGYRLGTDGLGSSTKRIWGSC